MSAANIYPSYTYLIGWSKHNIWYYGVRYANSTIPEKDLWVKYFTSSKNVQNIRKKFNDPDVIQIRKKFDCPKKAIAWEKKVLLKLNVLNQDKWINKNIGGACYPVSKENNPNYRGNKGADNPMFGKKHSDETKNLLRKKAKQRTNKNGMFGKTHTDEVKKKLSDYNTGENNPQFIGYFITPWGKFCSTVEAVKNSPVKISTWTINRWCKKDNHKQVHQSGVNKSLYLKKEDIGKTFNQLGFNFEML